MAFTPDPKEKNPIQRTWTETGLKGFRKKLKYNNVKTEYRGLKYDSKLEVKAAMDLDWRLKAGDIKEWKRQVKIDLRVNGVHICNYFVDFFYIDKHGQHVYLECKGLEMELWKMKWKLFTALIDEIDPGAELVVLKEKR